MIAASSSSISGLIIIYLTKGKEGLKGILSSLLNWRVNPLWYVVALFLFPAVMFVSITISVLLGNPSPNYPDLFTVVPVFFMLLLTAGLGEEIGWRGYASSKMRETQGALKLSLVIGVIWSFWHLPLFWFSEGGFMEYSLAQEYGLILAFILFASYIIILAILHGWIYFATNENLLMVVLFHAALNAAGYYFTFADIETITMVPLVIFLIIMICISIGAIKVFSPEKLSRAQD